tara:strand:- start:12 stop:248 length:237 start_codon:yes stop_codon:yes gene_type:complete
MKAKIQQSGKLKGKAEGQQNIIAKSASLTSSMALGDLSDVDVTGQTDGVMMIYNGSSGKYEVKTQIQNENLNIIGGTY